MHKQRWITGIIALPVVLTLIALGGAYWAYFLSVVSVLALWEFNRIQFSQNDPPPALILTASGYIAAPLMVVFAHHDVNGGSLWLLSGVVVAGGMRALQDGDQAPHRVAQLAGQVLGLIYLVAPLVMVVLIRNAAQGAAWIFFLLLVIFAGDTGAYYVGSYVGRHKLCPQISPKKTIEGAVGGVAANAVAAALAQILFLDIISLPAAVALGMFAGAVGQTGDLFESVFKRAAKIKDSGVILPGHGGILDRIDAVLFAIPVVYGFQLIFL